MKVSIAKSEIKGRVKTPSSKSYTIRGLMCAALARGESEIINPLVSDDTGAAADVLTKIGVLVRQDGDLWRVSGGNFITPDTELFCGDSAATLRFMTAICALIPGKCRLVTGPSLAKRPVGQLVQALRQLGVNCSSNGGLPPVVVEGGGLKGGTAELPGNISSQFVSALLLASPLAQDTVTIRLTAPLESRPYVAMTLECMAKFGIKVLSIPDGFKIAPQRYSPARYEVEGDWSSASYFLALGAVSGELEVENLNPASLQGDKVILEFLRKMGARVAVKKNSVVVKKSKLRAVRTDLTDCIDLLPTMAVLAALAEGQSEFTGINRARLKESDRVAAIREGLQRMGIAVNEGENTLAVSGSMPRGAVVDSKGDHRLAMAFSVLGAAVGGIVIESADCVSKTFPEFWDIMKSIGGRIKADGE